jgi:ribosome-binding protein aMBF1 (putative translation factor)
MGMKINKFYKGSAVFKCKVCGRGTRDTGVQSAGNDICPQCYDLAGIENEINDGHSTYAERREEVQQLLTELRQKGGDVSTWAEVFK